MDRISQLPEGIVHRILSCLHASPAELVRMSVLSKDWFNLTASFPLLDFSIVYFTNVLRLSQQSFFKYVEYTTSRFCHQNLPAHKFKIVATIREPADFDIVNKCLQLLLTKGVRELDILIANLPIYLLPKYRLPNVLLSVSVLKSLTLNGCDLPSSFMVDAVNFKSLTHLSLQNVHIDDQVIKHLTTSCPLLQDLRICWCHGFKSFCVYGHQNLQKVRFQHDTQVERIDIEAPNLSDFFVVEMNQRARGPPRMNLASCKTLTTVTYKGNPLLNSNFLSNFPFIENLVLVTTFKCKNLKLSSHSLRTMVLHSNCELEDIEFRTPNLVLFIYSCEYSLLSKPWPLPRHSTHLKACMQCYLNGYIDSLWFQKLRLFFDKKNGFKVFNLYIHTIYSEKFTELEKLKAIELPPYELKHVELQLDTHEESLAHIAFVDAVLWCCRPRSLTLRSSLPFIDFEDVVKFTYEKLLQQEDEGYTNIKIVSPSSSKAEKNFMDLKSLSMALSCDRKTISFIKEKVKSKKKQDN